MKHYLKKQHDFYTSYIFFNEQKLNFFDFSTTKSLEIYKNFSDIEELQEILKNRISDGYKIITRKEFNDAFIELNKELNEIIKEL